MLECFRTREAADARVAILSSQAAASFSCATPLRLYENGGWWGRTLYFYSRGYWQNLGDYGFDNQLSSYIVGACWTYLAENNNGGGGLAPRLQRARCGRSVDELGLERPGVVHLHHLDPCRRG